MEKQRGVRKTRIGKVVSDKMDKTVVVEVKRLVAHPLYHKIIRRRSRIKAHDPNNSCQVGDKVLLEETRPISRDKRWRVREVLEKAQ
jgi:small subunit ribosomal protein S17